MFIKADEKKIGDHSIWNSKDVDNSAWLCAILVGICQSRRLHFLRKPDLGNKIMVFLIAVLHRRCRALASYYQAHKLEVRRHRSCQSPTVSLHQNSCNMQSINTHKRKRKEQSFEETSELTVEQKNNNAAEVHNRVGNREEYRNKGRTLMPCNDKQTYWMEDMPRAKRNDTNNINCSGVEDDDDDDQCPLGWKVNDVLQSIQASLRANEIILGCMTYRYLAQKNAATCSTVLLHFLGHTLGYVNECILHATRQKTNFGRRKQRPQRMHKVKERYQDFLYNRFDGAKNDSVRLNVLRNIQSRVDRLFKSVCAFAGREYMRRCNPWIPLTSNRTSKMLSCKEEMDSNDGVFSKRADQSASMPCKTPSSSSSSLFNQSGSPSFPLLDPTSTHSTMAFDTVLSFLRFFSWPAIHDWWHMKGIRGGFTAARKRDGSRMAALIYGLKPNLQSTCIDATCDQCMKIEMPRRHTKRRKNRMKSIPSNESVSCTREDGNESNTNRASPTSWVVVQSCQSTALVDASKTKDGLHRGEREGEGEGEGDGDGRRCRVGRNGIVYDFSIDDYEVERECPKEIEPLAVPYDGLTLYSLRLDPGMSASVSDAMGNGSIGK